MLSTKYWVIMYKTAIFITALLCATVALAADTITGAVHNESTGKPSAGDEVVLLRLGEGMQQESRTTTDAQGAFTLNVLSPKDQHLVQVSHQGVNYDQPVTGTGPLDVVVYNAVAKVPGLRGPIGIAQIESDGKLLKITEMYDIANNSNPPVTQSRPDNFEITVPSNAVFDSVEVRRGQGIWLKATPAPVKGQSGRYNINFPLRPGDTLFKFRYHVPYAGPTTLHLRVPYPIDKFGVMHPPSMTFRPLRAGAFTPPQKMPGNLTIEAAVAAPTVGDVPAFEISGMGQAPEHGTQGAVAPPPAVSAPPPSNAHPSAAKPPAAADQSSKETWLMIGGIVVILLVGVLTFWRMRAKPVPMIVSAKPNAQTPLLDSLKEELFQLESNRLHGSISAEQYAATKQALTETIQRAMAKNP
jgi:hypothetical protein